MTTTMPDPARRTFVAMALMLTPVAREAATLLSALSACDYDARFPLADLHEQHGCKILAHYLRKTGHVELYGNGTVNWMVHRDGLPCGITLGDPEQECVVGWCIGWFIDKGDWQAAEMFREQGWEGAYDHV